MQTQEPLQGQVVINMNDFPNQIKLTGLPIIYCGWNNHFMKTNEVVEGYPVYHMDSYIYLNVFPVQGATIKRRNNEWIMCCDNTPSNVFIKKIIANSTFPYGLWSYNSIINPEF